MRYRMHISLKPYDYGCPENPFTVRSALMKINNSIKPLFNDRISVINDGKDSQML